MKDPTVLSLSFMKKNPHESRSNRESEDDSHTSGRMRVCGALSPQFSATSAVRQGCFISLLLFTFAIRDALLNVFHGGVKILPSDCVLDGDYADGIVFSSDKPTAVQNFEPPGDED